MMRIIFGASFPIELIKLHFRNTYNNNIYQINIINFNIIWDNKNNNNLDIVGQNYLLICIDKNIIKNDILMFITKLDQNLMIIINSYNNNKLYHKNLNQNNNLINYNDIKLISFISFDYTMNYNNNNDCLDKRNNINIIIIIINPKITNNINNPIYITNETQQKNDTNFYFLFTLKKSEYAFNNNNNNYRIKISFLFFNYNIRLNNNQIIIKDNNYNNKSGKIFIRNKLGKNNNNYNNNNTDLSNFKMKNEINFFNNNMNNNTNYKKSTLIIFKKVYQEEVINCQKTKVNKLIKNCFDYIYDDGYHNKNNLNYLNDRDYKICDDLYLIKNNKYNITNNNITLKKLNIKTSNVISMINNNNNKYDLNFNYKLKKFTKMPNFVENSNEKTPTNINKFNNKIINTDKIATNNYNCYNKITNINDSKMSKLNDKNNQYYGPATNLGWGIIPGSGLKGGGEEKNGNQANNWNHGPNWPNATNMNTQRNNPNNDAINQKNQTNNQGAGVAGNPNQLNNVGVGNPVGSNQNSSSNSQNWNQNAQQNVQEPNSNQSNNQPNNVNSVNSTSGNAIPAVTATKIDAKLNSLRESLFSVDGWGGNFVNQSTVWDLPKSPQFSKRQNSSNDIDENLPMNDNQIASNSSKFNNFCWNKINNGTELWEANLRNGGQLGGAVGGTAIATGSSNEKQKKPVPYHPLTNLGGIWGENEFEHDMEIEFNNMDANPPHQNLNTINFNEEEDENIYLRKKHRNIDNFDNYHDFLVAGGAGNGPTTTPSNIGGGGGGGNGGGSSDVIRGDPRGISGRLNGNPEIWNQNQQNFNQNTNFFNSQNFQNKNQIFQNQQQQNFMNYSNIEKNQIDFNINQQQQQNTNFNQQNPAKQRNPVGGGNASGAVGGGVGIGNISNIGGVAGGNVGGGNSGNNSGNVGGGGFNNFVDELGTSIWGNFNQNPQNINQNPTNAINQNFPAIRNQNLNQKRGGNASNWTELDKNVGGIGSGWNKFGGGEKPSSTPWTATPPTPTANQPIAPINPQNPNSIQISQTQNILNTQKFENPEIVDWKNPQKNNFNITNQDIFHQSQLAQQNPPKSQFLPFQYQVNKNNQNHRYLNSNNEMLFPTGASNTQKSNKIDDFSNSCDFTSTLGDDFLMYNKNQAPNFNQQNTNFNLNFNQKQNLSSLHYNNQLNEFGAGAVGVGNSVGGNISGGGDNNDRLVRSGIVSSGNNGAVGGNVFHQQNNPQMPQSPPINLDNQSNANRLILERIGGMGGAGGLQTVVPPPQHALPMHSQQMNQRGNFVGNFQQNQQNFGQNPIVNSSYSNQPSTSQLRMLVQQITMAVQAGYLNNQILNQPLAPQTLILLNQLLQQIKQLQLTQSNLNRMSTSSSNTNPNNALQLSVQATKLKQSIANLQNQIASQQAIYMKQQSMNEFIGNFNEMNIKENFSSNQSRLNQWKLPSIESNELINPNLPNPIVNLGGDNFSRAPGTISKATTSTSTTNSNIGVGGILQPDGTWSNQVRDGGGWPTPEPEPEANFTDLVPEFEPGKPWKGSQIKTIEDDPSLTPGSVARSPLSICPTSSKDSNELFSTNSSKNSPNQEFCLSSNTWSFNPNMSNSSSMTSQKPSVANELWGSTSIVPPVPSGGDVSKVTPRGPPPGLGKYRNIGNLSNYAGIWNSTWLLLKNLTTQIDGSTLRTLCMQHGPLQNFHLYLNHGIALCKYSSREEAQKAQIALNNCVLGNTTICCESPHDSEVSNILQHLGIPSQNLQNTSNNTIPNVAVPIVPVAWRPPSQQVQNSNTSRSNVSDAWGTSSASSVSWPTSTTSSTSNNSANIDTNENSFLPENLLQSEI